MPRQKKQHLKKRKDGRYACRYKDQWFYGNTEDEALSLRAIYKEMESEKAAAPVKLKAYADGFLKRTSEGVQALTRHHHKVHISKLINMYGDLPINEITASMIKNLYSTGYTGCTSEYIGSAKSIFQRLFDAAMDDGIIKTNPARAKSAAPHKGKSGSHRAITATERGWIDNYCTDHPVFPAVMVMLYAGLRPQEAKALNIDESIDTDEMVIHVTKTVHCGGKNMKEYFIDDHMKTATSKRDVPLFPPVYDAIKDKHGMLVNFTDNKPTVVEWDKMWHSYKVDMETAINGMTFRKHKALSVKGAVAPWVPFTVSPYDLRHSFVTMCRDHDVELHTVIEWMGHADSEMILRIYDEVSSDRSKKEAEKLLKSAFRSHSGSQSKNEKGPEPLLLRDSEQT